MPLRAMPLPPLQGSMAAESKFGSRQELSLADGPLDPTQNGSPQVLPRLAQHINIDPLCKPCRIRTSLEHIYLLELISVQFDLALERSPNRMMVMSVAREHGSEIVRWTPATITSVHRGCVGGISCDHIASLEDGSCQCACRSRFSADETSPDSKYAADTISKFA